MKKHSGIQVGLFIILGTMGLVLKTQAQNTGIGTNTPASKLHVVGAGSNSSTSSLQIQNSTSPTPLLFVRDDGKVGIGTNAPTYRFQVMGRAVNPTNYEYGQVASFQDTTGNFKTFFSLNTAGSSWNPMTTGGDNGIFWVDDANIESNNGFIIGPHSARNRGI